MKNTKERLILGAFKLFLFNNFEKVTIADIEKETGVSRGSIFYYVESKEDLFIKVVDKFIFEAQSLKQKMNTNDYKTFEEFIQKYVAGINRTMAEMLSLSIVNIYKHYFNFIIQADKYYPNFKEKLNQLLVKENAIWKEIIVHSIETKELKKDIDVDYTIMQFRSVFLGLAFEQSFFYGLETNQLMRYYQYIYKKIKA